MLIQTIKCNKSGVSWTSLTSGDEAHQLLINDIDTVITVDDLKVFQQAYASTENISFALDASVVDGKLHLTRNWSSESQYDNYKAAILAVENNINSQLETIGWTFEETTERV